VHLQNHLAHSATLPCASLCSVAKCNPGHGSQVTTGRRQPRALAGASAVDASRWLERSSTVRRKHSWFSWF